MSLSNDYLRTHETIEAQKVELQSPFGPVIHVYSRKQALEDGVQFDVSEQAKEAGFRYPVFITANVKHDYVTVPEGVVAQDETGRLWDILWMASCESKRSRGSELNFKVWVRNDNKKPKEIQLVAQCGPMDYDDPKPCVTIMLPGE